ncbi:MAG: type II toxin-antitoxin system VapC family toxin [Proteobacteria bacterium]|nr:type II toxin-antitoxin system VapC family toxin [Pseudomonadota bacterium]MBI3497625.1 type II toxin-antitoxin system VapC family toxin [Pseudomonadota bacterium]
MVIDTSALIAILGDEPERRRFNELIEADPRRLVSAATVLEAAIVLEARGGELAGRELDLFLHRARVEVVAVDVEQVEIARSAQRRFGRGRHAAGLNYGDCFAYALAKASGEPLLYKGDDFTRTDVTACPRQT